MNYPGSHFPEMLPARFLSRRRAGFSLTLMLLIAFGSLAATEKAGDAEVELQPLSAQIRRLVEAMDYLGEPFTPAERRTLVRAAEDEDDEARAVAELRGVLDARSLFFERTFSPHECADRVKTPEFHSHSLSVRTNVRISNLCTFSA